MTMEEMKSAYHFGKQIIKDYKESGEAVPAHVYQRMLELADMMMEKQEG